MLSFIPIPTRLDDLNRYAPFWLPFLPAIAKRSKEPVARLLEQVAKFEVQVALAWDDDARRADGFIGLKYFHQGDDLVGEIVWAAGRDMRRWLPLLPEVERYCREAVGCTKIREGGRPGWGRLLKARGYKVTHITCEKEL